MVKPKKSEFTPDTKIISPKIRLPEEQIDELNPEVVPEVKPVDRRQTRINILKEMRKDPELQAFIVPNEEWNAVNAVLLLRIIKLLEKQNG